ncbi:MAG: hypothetical protein JWO33_2310 [Caulobacteraceae bacterium]|nr:hypothetical protein [Caulobacteraceae bacterium]
MDDPEARLQGFIDRFDPTIAALARACRQRVRAQFPNAYELVYDNYNALAIGYAGSERTSDCIVSLALLPRNVTLFFYYGVRLADAEGLLQGKGNQVRSIRLPTPAVLDEPAVIALMQTAAADSRTPLPAEPCGTIIKSVSAKQRPRRPAAGTLRR